MFRQPRSLTGLLGTAVASLLLAGSPALAQQQGWVVNQGGYNGFTQGSAAPAGTFFAPATFNPVFTTPAQAPAIAPSTSTTDIRSFYPSSAGEEYNNLSTRSATNRPVTINVSVPADAAITFDGTKTTLSGARRVFVSPPLAPGQEYAYQVTATWQQGGRQVTQTRRVTVHSGDLIHLSF